MAKRKGETFLVQWEITVKADNHAQAAWLALGRFKNDPQVLTVISHHETVEVAVLNGETLKT